MQSTSSKHGKSAVLVLGAGASAPFGLPLLGTFFSHPRSKDYILHNYEFKTLLQGLIWAPQGRTLESASEGLNIEEILSLVRGLNQEMDDAAGSDFQKLKYFTYKLIGKVLHDGVSTRARTFNPLISFLDNHFGLVTIATFNWDCLFEESYKYVHGSCYPNLAIEVRNWPKKRRKSGSFTLLKLHGSISWWLDEQDNIFYTRPGSQTTHLTDTWYHYSPESTTRPLILEPSSYKYADPLYRVLSGQWKALLQTLTTATDCFVIGYSLPDGDQKSRTLFHLAALQNPSLKFTLVDPSEATFDRYKKLLGSHRVKWLCTGLGDLNDQDPSLNQLLSH